MREAIDAGKLGWSLQQMNGVPEDQEGCNEFEGVLLADLQTLQKYLKRVLAKSLHPRPESRGEFSRICLPPFVGNGTLRI